MFLSASTADEAIQMCIFEEQGTPTEAVCPIASGWHARSAGWWRSSAAPRRTEPLPPAPVQAVDHFLHHQPRCQCDRSNGWQPGLVGQCGERCICNLRLHGTRWCANPRRDDAPRRLGRVTRRVRGDSHHGPGDGILAPVNLCGPRAWEALFSGSIITAHTRLGTPQRIVNV